MQERKLAAKLARIMGEINNVEKNGVNIFHNYRYAMEQDMLVAVRKRLADANIIVLTGITSVDVRDTAKDGFLTTIRTVHTFVDGDTGETLEASSAGQGTDKGDKGIYKAITGATKYFISKNFLIPTGDDPEGFDEKRESAGRAPKQAVKAAPAQSTAPAPKSAPAPPKPPINPNLPPNPWVGKLVGIGAPVKGPDGSTWTRWDIETAGHNGQPFNLSAFSSSIAEVAVNAISDARTVELVWKTKTDKQGKNWNTADSIHIIA